MNSSPWRAGLLVAVALLALTGSARADETRSMPADPARIENALVKRGVIKANATALDKDAAVQRWLQTKAAGTKEGNPLARKALDAREEQLSVSPTASIRGRKLGQPGATVTPSQAAWKDLRGEDKLLLIAVEFSDTPYTWTPDGGAPRTAAGPLHNQLPTPDNDFDLWIPDFNLAHYEDMLFAKGGWTFPSSAPKYYGETRPSMRDYYLEQSFGQYAIAGKAYGWYTLPRPEAYYGDDSASGHDNLGPGTMTTLIQNAVTAINNDPDPARRIPWAEYDTNGDCIIDHVLFIHAGADQSAGGGAQGDDAIWAHSSARAVAVEHDDACTPFIGLPYRIINNYTIMPEDGGVGVFAHEFGHDLGLPDEYDTQYTGRGESVAFWSLMSSGSWTGKPAQTQPPNMSIWARYALGWLDDNLATATLADLAGGVGVRLEHSARWGGANSVNAVRVSLPQKQVVVTVPPAGTYAWFGGKGDEIDTTLTRTVDLTAATGPVSLSFLTWYDIEENWDYGFVQVSADAGASWDTLHAAGMTATPDAAAYPTILDIIGAGGAGFTGNSGGWQSKTVDLSAYAGKSIQLRFRYITDWGTTGAGWYLDQIGVTANGMALLTEGAETADPAWTADGWSRSTGVNLYTQYYLLEWRNTNPLSTPYPDGGNIEASDAGLRNVYQFDPFGSTGNVNQPWFYQYNPGLVLWYRDTSYTDNWTRYHPGHGFLLVVDANSGALMRPPGTRIGGAYQGWGSLPWNTNVQSSNATFSLTRDPDLTLGYWGQVRTYNGANAVPVFDDSQSYWNSLALDASAKVPTYGFSFRILGEATDGSAAVVGLGAK